jgi:Domain of unknown function (DUF222)
VTFASLSSTACRRPVRSSALRSAQHCNTKRLPPPDLQGLLDPEAGQTLAAALEPLARPSAAHDDRSGGQRRADALVELARRNLEGGQLPQSGGVRPQLNVTVDLASLLGHPGALGGEVGGMGPLSPEACRRLACDGALTRVVVTRQPTGHPGDPDGHHGPPLEDNPSARGRTR